MRQRHLAGLLVCICVAWAASARADTVTYWNDVTLQAVTAERPGGHGFLDVALVHAAVHDAVQAIQRREPLVNTPNYPDYTSGANSVMAAMTTILARFFGSDTFTFSVTTNAPLATQKTRTFTRFSDAAAEVVDARILLGIHFGSQQ